jgi:hypothetical protein
MAFFLILIYSFYNVLTFDMYVCQHSSPWIPFGYANIAVLDNLFGPAKTKFQIHVDVAKKTYDYIVYSTMYVLNK